MTGSETGQGELSWVASRIRKDTQGSLKATIEELKHLSDELGTLRRKISKAAVTDFSQLFAERDKLRLGVNDFRAIRVGRTAINTDRCGIICSEFYYPFNELVSLRQHLRGRLE